MTPSSLTSLSRRREMHLSPYVARTVLVAHSMKCTAQRGKILRQVRDTGTPWHRSNFERKTLSDTAVPSRLPSSPAPLLPGEGGREGRSIVIQNRGQRKHTNQCLISFTKGTLTLLRDIEKSHMLEYLSILRSLCIYIFILMYSPPLCPSIPPTTSPAFPAD